LGRNALTHGDWSDQRDWEHMFKNPKKVKDGVAPVKECQECGYINYASARVCGECGCEFEIIEKVEDKVFELILLGEKTTSFDVEHEYNVAISYGYKPHKSVHKLQEELLKSLRYTKKNKYLENKNKILNDLKKAFHTKYKEFHKLNSEVFKLHPKNLTYWYDQLEMKINEKYI
jgi:hypothetical protein